MPAELPSPEQIFTETSRLVPWLRKWTKTTVQYLIANVEISSCKLKPAEKKKFSYGLIKASVN